MKKTTLKKALEKAKKGLQPVNTGEISSMASQNVNSVFRAATAKEEKNDAATLDQGHTRSPKPLSEIFGRRKERGHLDEWAIWMLTMMANRRVYNDMTAPTFDCS